LNATAKSTLTPRDARVRNHPKENRGAIVAHPAVGFRMRDIYAPSSNGTRPQIELFPSTALALPIVSAPRRCRCGCATAMLGASQAMHAGRLSCSACGAFMGWARHALVAEIRGSTFVTGISSFQAGCRP